LITLGLLQLFFRLDKALLGLAEKLLTKSRGSVSATALAMR
jgi:hypothetical protein